MTTATPDYLAGYRAGAKSCSSGAKAPRRRMPEPDQKTLDAATEKVGTDFPGVGAWVRAAWISSV